jgi:hypothetical protein
LQQYRSLHLQQKVRGKGCNLESQHSLALQAC